MNYSTVSELRQKAGREEMELNSYCCCIFLFFVMFTNSKKIQENVKLRCKIYCIYNFKIVTDAINAYDVFILYVLNYIITYMKI